MDSDGLSDVDWIKRMLDNPRVENGEGSSSAAQRSKPNGPPKTRFRLPLSNLQKTKPRDVRAESSQGLLSANVQQTAKTSEDDTAYSQEGLCDYCSELSIGNLKRAGSTDRRLNPITDATGGHHHSIQDLEASAETCNLCRLLVRALRPYIGKLRMASSPPPTAPHWGNTRFQMWAQNMDMDDDEREGKLTHLIFQWHDWDDGPELLLSASRGSPASAHIEQHFLDPFADSEANIAKIERILHSCKARHTQCQLNHQVSPNTSARLFQNVTTLKALPSAVLPTRVVVAQYEDHGKTGPFLLETVGRTGVYAALSYRWSPDSQIITTRQTLESNKTKLDFGSHTGTRIFSDAVSLCRKLGIPYLWIDALCIIQHDPTDPLSNLDDWEKEAKSMGRVYGDCVLTIAATGASDDSSIGLFGDRSAISQSIELPFRLELRDKPNGTFLVSLPPEGFNEEVNDSELYSRGWVMQERLLSHRYLHFGKTQWFWQCRQSTISEMPGFEDQEKTIGTNFESGKSDNYLDKPTKVVRRWMKIVEAYSKLKFTVNPDRFVAIQGIVSETAKATGDNYLYGMWSKLLYVQLQWFIHPRDSEIESGSEDVSPASEHHRPSWSWQSTTKRISYHDQFEGDKFYEKVPDEPIARNYLKAVTVTVIRPIFGHVFTSRPFTPGLPPRKVLVMRTRFGAVSLDFDDDSPVHVIKQRQKGVNGQRYNITLQARSTGNDLEGKEVGRCNLDKPSFRKFESCCCIGISENWDRKGTFEELRSMNVLIVLLQKQGQYLFAKRIGEGIVSDRIFLESWLDKGIIMQ
ncbi:hypothetical protein IFR05_000642 [Cadophora sp. M221]|nr:hypothetical protein IFR05_000642 [Cadophora sp. M221]